MATLEKKEDTFITVVEFSYNKKLVATGHKNNKIKIWDS